MTWSIERSTLRWLLQRRRVAGLLRNDWEKGDDAGSGSCLALSRWKTVDSCREGTMQRRPIHERPKKKRGLGWFVILLLIAGFIAGVVLVKMGIIDPGQIPHP